PLNGDPFENWPADKEMMASSMMLVSSVQPKSVDVPLSAGEQIIKLTKSALRKSYLFYYLVQKLHVLQMMVFPGDITSWKRAVIEGARSERIDASWRFVERQLTELKRMEREYHFRFFVVIVPLFEQMTSPGFEREAYQARLIEIGRRHDIPMIDPLHAIRRIRPYYPDFFIPFDGHPNGRIYDVIAEEVSKVLIGDLQRHAAR